MHMHSRRCNLPVLLLDMTEGDDGNGGMFPDPYKPLSTNPTGPRVSP